ncbi:unnamed protein product [Malus baccata var. baccata]
MDTSTALEASSSSSPSSSSTTTTSSSSPYDVFLSFSGEDTRKTFTDHLYWTMKDAGIDFFMEENESIRRGENISDKVKQIIEGSRVSVIVFSSRYADSIWCLEELVQIMECRRTLKQMVLPIFYDLSPSDGIGTFVQAFQKHRERFHEDTDIQEKIWRWTDALTEAAGLTVWVFETTNGYEGMFIREIIDEITRQLKSPTPVGIAFSELQRLRSPKLEDIDSTEHTDTASSGSSAKSSLSMSPLKKRCHEPDHSDSTSSKFPKRSDIVKDILALVNDNCLSSNSSPSNDNNDDQNADDNVGSVGIVRVNQEPIHSIFSPDGKFRRSVTWRKLRDPLGSGSYGTVYEGLTDDGIFFAVKEVSLLDQGSQGKQSVIQLEQEISLLSQFEHDNIVRYLGTHKDETKLYIFLELVTKGSLVKLYQNYNLEDSQVSGYTRQILSGLTYLHKRRVLHRDIKCANILVHASGSVKLADFGLAKVTKLNELKSSKGTAYWMAPEVVNQMNGGYGFAADIWSLGCTVLEMLTGQPPYFPLEWTQALFQIGSGKLPPVPKSLSSDAKDFILKCLQVDPNSRPTAAQLLNHPFVERPLHASSVPASHCNSLRS